MFKLEYEDKFHIKDRGTVYTLTVDENLYEEYENLVGTDVEIDDKICTIEAIEKFRPSIQSKWNEGKRGVGLLVKYFDLSDLIKETAEALATSENKI